MSPHKNKSNNNKGIFLVTKFLIVLCFGIVVFALYEQHEFWNKSSLLLLFSPTSISPIDDTRKYIALNNDSYFSIASEESYKPIIEQERRQQQQQKINFNVKKWEKRTTGGLTDLDRILLAKLYSNARSVFEYGLGESTYIADAVGVSRYAGIDSDVVWVNEARQKVSAHYRFYYGDIGNTKEWGYPENESLAKIAYQYQVAPLVAEQYPFDVYMVDGRYRVACVLLSFLHASARGAGHNDTIVLLHDCYSEKFSTKDYDLNRKRDTYFVLDTILDLVDHSTNYLCVYRRKPNITDQDLYTLWQEYRANIF